MRHLALQCGYRVCLQVTRRVGPCSGACRFYAGGYGFELACFMITSLLVGVLCYVFVSRERNDVRNQNMSFESVEHLKYLGTVKVKDWTVPEGSRRLRLPDFNTIGT